MPDNAAPKFPDSPPALGSASHPELGLEALAKMSTTAGLGSGDYAAVSPLSVATLLLAILGGMALFSEYLLVVPLAAVVCGVLALLQISHSNGVLTGKWLAVFGIAGALVLGGIVVGAKIVHEARIKPSRDAILGVIASLNKSLADKNYAEAYKVFSPHFQERVPEEEFARTLGSFDTIPQLGGLAGVEWNQQIVFDDSPGVAANTAQAGMLVKFRKTSEANREVVDFINIDGKWTIEDVPRLFPPKKKPGA